MKRIILSMLMMLALVSFAQAQTNTHPQTFGWVYEDSANGTTMTQKIWNIGVTNDADTSIAFSVFRMPEDGLSLNFYQHAGDSGTVIAYLQQTAFSSTAAGFGSDSAAAVSYITMWYTADTVTLPKAVASGTTVTRSMFVWNPTLKGPADQCRLILVRPADKGTVVRTLSIIRCRQD